MRRIALVLLFASVLGLPVRPAQAYSFQYAGTARPTPLRWSVRTIPVALSSSLFEPQSNIKAGSDVIGAVRRALVRWSEASGLEFLETVVKEDSISPATGTGDGRSLITVAGTAENLTPFAGASSDMPARTRVFFARSGAITEADVALNPYQQFSTDGTTGTFDLESTITHELGHLLGLEHSGVIGATMQPRQGRNGLYNMPATSMRTLSEDDRAGIGALYGTRSGLSRAVGSVSGIITRAGSKPVYGASVWLEEVNSGRVVAAYTTGSDGSYDFAVLTPGNYRLLVEALDGPVALDELASQRGPYSRLGQSAPLRFRAQEIGEILVAGGEHLERNANVSTTRTELNPYLIGFNGQLSSVPVPVTPGRTYRIFLGGEGLDPKTFAVGGVTTSSPFLTVNPASITAQQFGQNLTVISFDINVAVDAPNGDYSIRVVNTAGAVAYLTAGVTIDGTINPWPIFTF
ncbi:MAG: matrixin family metalloprotease [Pyrinomonadaceae bacterium]